MTAADIERLAGRGEGQTLEFKQRTPEPPRLAKEIIAFANTDGGRLIIGIEDDGNVVGVKDAEEEEFALRNALEAHCAPKIKWRTERVEITRKREVVVVAVPRSKLRPHFLVGVDRLDGKMAYVRVGDRSIEASREAVALMTSAENKDDVQFEFREVELRLMKYLEQYGRIAVKSFSRFVNISDEEARMVLVTLTRAGVLVHHVDLEGDYFTLVYDQSCE